MRLQSFARSRMNCDRPETVPGVAGFRLDVDVAAALRGGWDVDQHPARRTDELSAGMTNLRLEALAAVIAVTLELARWHVAVPFTVQCGVPGKRSSQFPEFFTVPENRAGSSEKSKRILAHTRV